MTEEAAFAEWMESESQCKRWQRRVARLDGRFKALSILAGLTSSGALAGLLFLLEQPLLRAAFAIVGTLATLVQFHLVRKDDIVELSAIYGEWVNLCSLWERTYRSLAAGSDVGDEPLRLRERADAVQRRAVSFATESRLELESIQREVAESHGIELPSARVPG